MSAEVSELHHPTEVVEEPIIPRLVTSETPPFGDRHLARERGDDRTEVASDGAADSGRALLDRLVINGPLERDAGTTEFAWPDMAAEKNLYEISVPHLASLYLIPGNDTK